VTAVRERFALGAVGAALARLRGPELPMARSLADAGDPLSRPLDVEAITSPDREVRTIATVVEADFAAVVHLGALRGVLPPIAGRDAEEFAAMVELHAAATWGAWVAGTPEPEWAALPGGVRERLLSASRVGLAAVGIVPAPELEP
jgi:hypothetical protein